LVVRGKQARFIAAHVVRNVQQVKGSTNQQRPIARIVTIVRAVIQDKSGVKHGRKKIARGERGVSLLERHSSP
jgi:hypothetical protein